MAHAPFPENKKGAVLKKDSAFRFFPYSVVQSSGDYLFYLRKYKKRLLISCEIKRRF
ncbi:hypothetical protein OBV_42920 [Oscillibacter valericigenes Sjm18-20]|nr:hypothetical protein OBV_42920 [Oscillibacter valericigenes Sjm18-20]